ncbi:hypothetical protein PMAYCL1PPCAC_29914, partial [Pristionchus mayeri]
SLFLECIGQFIESLHDSGEECHGGHREIVHPRELLPINSAFSAMVFASAGEDSEAISPRASNSPSFFPSAIVGVTIPPMSIA